MSTPDTASRSDFQQLSAEVDQAITEIRQRLRAILDAVLPGEYGARSLGRSLGLERMTAWRCWTIAHVADSAAAIEAMPGRVAWSKILKRLSERGAAPEAMAATESAIERFETLVRARGVDRTTMRALAAGALDSDRETAALLDARRGAVRSAAKLYGVHVRMMAMAHVISPGPDRASLAIGLAAAYEGLGRDRPGRPWPIIRRSATHAEGESGVLTHQPLGDEGELPSVIHAVSSKGIVGAELRSGRHERGVETTDLCDVPPRRNHRLRACLAEFIPQVAMSPTAGIEPACMQTSVQLPTDLVIADLLVHADVVRHTDPAASLLGTPVVHEFLQGWETAPRLPLEASVRPIGSLALPKRFAAADRGYREALGRVLKAHRASIDRYEIFRIAVPFPPMHSVIAVTCELDEAARRERWRG